MSFVRLLSTAKGSPRPLSPSSATQSYKPTLSLHVPGYGAIIAALSEPNPLDLSADLEPKYDLDLRGELEIRMPHGSGRMRCKSIRVGMRSMLKIAIKGKRKEEHELSDCRVEIIGGTSEGVWLEEGAQRFEFTLLLPPKLAPQNWVPGANISHDLYAELEGVPEPTTTSPFFRTLSLSSFSSGKTPTSSRLPSRSPSPTGSPSLSNAALGSTSMSITRQEGAYIPQAPSYDESQAVYTGKSLQSGSTEDDRWITGTHDTHRTVMIVFNPHPTGQVNSLDEQVTGFTEGVGVYKWRMSADQWHIAAWPLFRFLLPDPASTVTLFAFRYSLNQTVMITSPSDPDNPHTVTTNFPFVERGKIPHRDHGNPSPALPALWRGKDAKGSDEGEFKIEAKGQMPKDDVLRPSTIPGCARSTWTPIHIAHTLVAEVFFSIWGKNEFGEDMPRPGPGGLQVMRIKRPVVVPSCALIPQILDLPTYRPAAHLNGGSDRDACKCKLCGLRPHEIVCQQCPPTVIPHLRHDLDPTLTGNKSGVCPACAAKRLVPDGEPDWKTCACGMAVDNMEERMKAFLQEMDAEGEADRRRTGTEMKEEAERGRRFSRN